MTRLFSIAATLLALASLRCLADDTAPALPTTNEAARARNVADDPNASTKSDQAKPSSLDSDESGAPNNAAEPSTDSPAPKPKPETPTERTARLTKLFRYQISGGTRRILDTTFQYPKNVAQLEADYDKSLSDERYADGEKIALELMPLLPRQVQVFTLGGMHTVDFAAFAKSWKFEAELCHRAHLGEFGNGPDRRRGVALARLQKVSEMVEAWKLEDAENHSVTSLATLLLRAVEIAERQSVDVEDEITRTVNLALDRVKVDLPTLNADVPAGTDLRNILFRDSVSLKLKDTPDDALLIIDVINRSEEHRFTIAPLVAEKPIRRSELGNTAIGLAIQQKASDAALQDRVHSTLARLFPSETIEVHVVRGNTVILRASLKQAAHEQQIVSIAEHMAATVLNQMSVNHGDADPSSPVPEKLEPIGVDEPGLREVLARLYPKEHIEAHVLPNRYTVVLRGHLSRPEYAQQVFDIASTSYANVLYQMTPLLPVKATPPQATPTQSTTRGATGMMSGMATGDEVATPAIASPRPTDVPEAALDREARQLATKFRTAKLDEQPALRRQLEQLTERHFKQRQQRRQSEIEDLAHRVDVLRVTHHRRQENKTAVIQQRVQDLLDPNADLRWDEPQRTQSEGLGTGSHQREATGSSRKQSASMPKDRP